jgi:hypothetical protein
VVEIFAAWIVHELTFTTVAEVKIDAKAAGSYVRLSLLKLLASPLLLGVRIKAVAKVPVVEPSCVKPSRVMV